MCIGGERHNAATGSLQWRELHYAYRSTLGAWTQMVVEGADEGLYVGEFCEMKLDATGTLHIVHYDTHNQDLRYATNSTPPLGVWTTGLIDETGSVGSRPSLTMDEFGTLGVSYYDATNEVLKRARKPQDENWETMLLTAGTGLETEGFIGQFSALHAEDSANLHVAYYEGESRDLYYAFLATCPV
jgi:preprotein translocase subunit Sss1